MRMTMRVIVAIGVVLLARGMVTAAPSTGTVALLPLDAEKSLEIYSQPVASEIARVLVADGIDVVVVGAKMAMPQGARLVVDGTIKSGKGTAITLSIRVRDPREGIVVDTLVVTAASLTEIEHAEEELAGRVLPSVKGRLAAQEHAEHHDVAKQAVTVPPRVDPHPISDHPMLVAVSARPAAGVEVEPLRAALVAAVEPWAKHHKHEAKTTDISHLAPVFAAKTVAQAGADLAVTFELIALTIDPGPVPMARARVRVQVADTSKIVFDRVIVTDTILGERGMAVPRLAERVAREVLAIADPHIRWP